MTIDYFVNCLFYPRPEQWGLRGDPILWTDLENHMRNKPIPKTALELNQILISLYTQLVGKAPIKDDEVRVEKYAAYGMSGGVVSANFWLNSGFSIIVERYDNIIKITNNLADSA